MRGFPRAQYEKCVERISVMCSVNLRISDVEVYLAKITANSREEIFLILDINHDLKAFAYWGKPRLDDRFIGIHTVVKCARLPCYVLSVMAQEVCYVKLAPEYVLDRVRKCVKAKQAQG